MNHLIAPAIGLVIQLDAGIDLTGNTGLTISWTNPAGTETIKTATINGANSHLMEYIIVAGDFDPSIPAMMGNYILVAGSSFAGALPLYSDPVDLKVIKKGQRIPG